MQEPSIFTRIIRGEIPSHKVYEDERVIAFLTINPLSEGHTLVVPKKQVDQIWDLSDDNYDYLWQVAKKIALHLRDVLEAERIGVVVKGFEVPHVHIHLIPVSRGKHVNFDPETNPSRVDDARLAAMAERIHL